MDGEGGVLGSSPRRSSGAVSGFSKVALAICALLGTLGSFDYFQRVARPLRRLGSLGAPSGEAVVSPSLISCMPRPVFLMHGLESNAAQLGLLSGWIKSAFPGTKTFPISLFENEDSHKSLLQQVPDIAKHIRSVVANDPSTFEPGYDLVCHSQGGLICRTLVQFMDDHRVHTLISLAAPQNGVYGTSYRARVNAELARYASGSSTASQIMRQIFGPNPDIDTIVYNQIAQNILSVSNLWNDPMRRTEYVEKNLFLPVYNGLTPDEVGNQRRKANLLRLQKAVFLVGDFGSSASEGVLEPWQTGLFGQYRRGSQSELEAVEDTKIFDQDTIGLKSLKQQGRVHLNAPKGVGHADWITKFEVFALHIMPHLGQRCGSNAILTTTTTTTTMTTTSTTEDPAIANATTSTATGAVIATNSSLGGEEATKSPATTEISWEMAQPPMQYSASMSVYRWPHLALLMLFATVILCKE